ncbi:MAG TPA: aromatic ring-hydroxylating dioxygenase subunit alpha [Burkholderiaceae bacterium]|jgi:choline monooxygenase|nr:aromatic ring-hydroxylating dioxygenase subunit alpha [Burkholderiaceae bacterium]
MSADNKIGDAGPDVFEIDADITQAATLDKSFYLATGAWEMARERLFARSWQWLGDLQDVAEPGSLAPRVLLPGCLDEPLLLARDEGGALRCLSNVCTHRGNLLVQAPCRARQIRCGYHSRRFDLEGRMTFMPEFEGACDFPLARDDLAQVPFGAWLGHGFASIAPLAALEDVLGDVTARLAWLSLSTFTHDPRLARDYEFDAHWALYVENYLEGLHIPFIHPALTRTLDLKRYAYELHEFTHLQLAVARDGETAFDPPAGSPDHGQRIAAYYFWVFPNLMLNVYPWGLSVNLVQPVSPTRTRVQFRSYVRDPSLLASGAGGALDEVELEDEAVVQTVQRGLRSRYYSKGRYSPTREQGVHQFHRLIARFMKP